MKHQVIRLLVTALLLFGLGFGQNQATFTNPLLSSGPDPFLTYFQGHYYMTQTTGVDIQIRKAKSLAGLSTAEITYVVPGDEPERCCSHWAPEFHRLKNPAGEWRWYIYYTAGPSDCCADQRMHVLESAGDDPLGPYTYKSRLYDAKHDYLAIDPTVFENKGQLYVVYSGTPQANMPFEKPQNLYIALLENPWTISGERVQISNPEEPWEYGGGPVNEGPAMVKRANKLYLAYSGSGCWTDDYAVGLLVASENANLMSPKSWQKMPRPFLQRNNQAGVYGPGHNSFFKSPDGKEDWIIYHANPKPGLECKDERNPRAQKIVWGPDGLPRITAASVNTPVALPSGDPGVPR
jgi:GH43 family beta-xylosidase